MCFLQQNTTKLKEIRANGVEFLFLVVLVCGFAWAKTTSTHQHVNIFGEQEGGRGRRRTLLLSDKQDHGCGCGNK